jgi:hypothetical protein
MKLQKTIRANLSNGLLPVIFGRRMSAFSSFRKLHRGTYETAVKTIWRSVFIILFGVCFLPYEAAAAQFKVNSTGDEGGTEVICSFEDFTGCTLRRAIALANSSPGIDSIVFEFPANDPFCTNGVCTINAASALPAITTPMSIEGPGADKLTIRNGANIDRAVFLVTSMTGPIRFRRLTISNGNSTSGFGGGISALSFLSLEVTVEFCVISGNSANRGGGIYSNVDMFIISSLINGNTGEGITNVGNMRIINSTITGNSRTGIENVISNLILTHSTVSSNGGVSPSGVFTGLVNSGSGAVFTVKSCIIARNSNQFVSDVNGAFVSAGFNLIGKRDGSTGFTASTDQTGTIDAPLNPRFDPGGLKDNGGTTRSITLMSGSPAIDKGSSLTLLGSVGADQRGFSRTFDNPAIPNAAGGDGTDIGALERRKAPFDFDGDGRTDVSVFRPAPGEWWINNSSSGSGFVAQFGASTDKIVPGDYTGDGKADVAVFRPGTGQWFILRSEDASFFAFPFGSNGDIPAPADYDGDGRADAAVFRPSTGTWYILNSGGAGTSIVQFGAGGDNPVAADFDGDGKADIAIFRPSDGSWWYLRSSDAQFRVFRFGVGTDKPVQGDYTGDRKADIAIWRPSTGEWFVQRSENESFYSIPFGTAGDLPTPGDYDGDGRFDTAVFRPSSATWFVQRTSAGILFQQFGSGSDLPAPGAFVP